VFPSQMAITVQTLQHYDQVLTLLNRCSVSMWIIFFCLPWLLYIFWETLG